MPRKTRARKRKARGVEKFPGALSIISNGTGQHLVMWHSQILGVKSSYKEAREMVDHALRR